MITYSGKSVLAGIAIGKISLYKKAEVSIHRYHVEDVNKEILRFEEAKERALKQLTILYETALKEVGESGAGIFEVHQMMLEDLDYIASIVNIIESQKVNAEYAIGETGDNFAAMFSAMEDDYMRARAADVKDITESLLSEFQTQEKEVIEDKEPVIILAEDLAPSQTVQLNKDKVLAFVTRQGSSNSHTAILARAMDIPAIVQCDIELLTEYNGKLAVVDGYDGKIYIDPDEDILTSAKKHQEQQMIQKKLLQEYKGKENITLDGKKIEVYANIGNVKDVPAVMMNDAGGIGLFRSEFLYLEAKDFPTENEQFLAYKTVAENMAGKKVIIRTLDIGADKKVGYFNLAEEDNPALGYRAIRICLEQKDIFKTQLRAIYRASAFGKIAIMFPMIISMEEVQEIKEVLQEVKKELKEQNISYKDIETGIMIETPAAALISDQLAKEVDFFSIGTNDLTQYTLAIDRQNMKLERFYNPHHPAVLKLIQIVVDNAHANGIWAGICGELAADTSMTETFLKMGVDELSVSPRYVLGLRKKIREINLSKI